jgi:ssDNA-binding Zn-finger/Zn-ribbon topoisomerase 1
MDTTLAACRCPRCSTRFALAGDPERGPDILHCPTCGHTDTAVLWWEREAWEVWELWRILETHLDRLPARWREAGGEWTLTGGESGAHRGLWRLECPACERESWLPAEARRCPACREEVRMRRAG